MKANKGSLKKGRKYSQERREKNQEYYLKNKQKIDLYNKEWSKKNRDKVSLSAQRRRALNPQKAREYQSQWNKKNADKVKKYQKKYLLKHPERLDKLKQWGINNPEKLQRAFEREKPKRKKYHASLQQKIKQEVMAGYSLKISNSKFPCCSLCNEKILDFLAIDHIEGARIMGHGKDMHSTKLYKILIKQNFPNGYRVLCHNCNRVKYLEILKKKKYSQNPEAIRGRKRRRENKKTVFEKYSDGSPKCICCGYDNIDCLDIDHIEGRRKMKHDSTMEGHKLYRYLIRNKFPRGFQLLCHKCNKAKSHFGKCPHKIE